MHTGLSFAEASNSYSSTVYNFDESLSMSPTQLLSLAIKKRRSLYEGKDQDFRRELANTGMISNLCKFLGEGRAKRRRRSRRRTGSKRRWQDVEPVDQGDQELVIDNKGEDQMERLTEHSAQIVPTQNEQEIQNNMQMLSPPLEEPSCKRPKADGHDDPFDEQLFPGIDDDNVFESLDEGLKKGAGELISMDFALGDEMSVCSC